jgi:hypothetical protein
MNHTNAMTAVAKHNEAVQEIMALAQNMTTEETDEWSRQLRTIQSNIEADHAEVNVREDDDPEIDAEDQKINRLNQLKKNAQIRKKQLKIRDQQKALVKLRRGSS